MKIFKDEKILAAFSDAEDGDLAFYNMDAAMAKVVWNGLPVVKEYGLPLPTFAHQVHQDRVMPVLAAASLLQAGEADGLISGLADRPVGVFSADCLPLLIYSENAVAAVHAGWRSTCMNIGLRAVEAFSREYGVGAGDLKALIGPCIGQCCLEMGEEVYQQFVETDPGWGDFFKRRVKWHLDLRGLNRRQLESAGLKSGNIIDHDECTFCKNGGYFSFRRQRQRNGSMFSFIVRRT
ncbi:MAG: peptidoglycan editing factor PgeF [Candidatus Riflebacteria bacterium]|jgi:YfiH family protein|nr:peptidoglycan editing factor PgeF [Candidatus Riflebacteria bacterium]